MLMFASPFFTSGRSAILPSIATEEELHTANTLTQTTQWTTLTLGGFSPVSREAVWIRMGVRSKLAFVRLLGMVHFAIARVLARASSEHSTSLTEVDWMRSWREYREGLRYMRSIPLIFAIAMVGMGWATGGGAAQILFGLFGEIVFQEGLGGYRNDLELRRARLGDRRRLSRTGWVRS